MESEERKQEVLSEKKEAKEIGVITAETGMMLSEKFVEQAGKQVELRSKLLMLGLKALKQHDFQDFGGKPYLEGEGAARIMAVVRGFRVGAAEFVVEHIAPHYFVECAIPIEFMGATTVAIGDCSTADVFFTGTEGGGGRYGKYKAQSGSETIAARLLLGDAKKKARENAISRGVCELLGIKGLTWEDLTQLGFNQDKAGSKIDFKQSSQGAEIKTLTVHEALNVAKGSIINIKGEIIDCKERTIKVKEKDTSITDYILADGPDKIKISKWGNVIEGLKTAQTIFAGHVTVSEFQGAKQYLAKEISIVEKEVVKNGDAETRTDA